MSKPVLVPAWDENDVLVSDLDACDIVTGSPTDTVTTIDGDDEMPEYSIELCSGDDLLVSGVESLFLACCIPIGFNEMPEIIAICRTEAAALAAIERDRAGVAGHQDDDDGATAHLYRQMAAALRLTADGILL